MTSYEQWLANDFLKSCNEVEKSHDEAISFFNQEDYPNAVKSMEGFIRLEPYNPKLLFLLSSSSLIKQLLLDAYEQYFLEIHPLLTSHIMCALALLYLGTYEDVSANVPRSAFLLQKAMITLDTCPESDSKKDINKTLYDLLQSVPLKITKEDKLQLLNSLWPDLISQKGVHLADRIHTLLFGFQKSEDEGYIERIVCQKLCSDVPLNHLNTLLRADKHPLRLYVLDREQYFEQLLDDIELVYNRATLVLGLSYCASSSLSRLHIDVLMHILSFTYGQSVEHMINTKSKSLPRLESPPDGEYRVVPSYRCEGRMDKIVRSQYTRFFLSKRQIQEESVELLHFDVDTSIFQTVTHARTQSRSASCCTIS